MEMNILCQKVMYLAWLCLPLDLCMPPHWNLFQGADSLLESLEDSHISKDVSNVVDTECTITFHLLFLCQKRTLIETIYSSESNKNASHSTWRLSTPSYILSSNYNSCFGAYSMPAWRRRHPHSHSNLASETTTILTVTSNIYRRRARSSQNYGCIYH